MTEETKSVVVIGAGQAGLSVCAKLRALGHTGKLALIGAEASAPYQRPPLSKAYALGEMDAERLLLRPDEFYKKNDILLRTSCTVASVNAADKTIILSDGERLDYDSLILATGSEPRRLPASLGGDLDGVFCIRSLADADRFAQSLASARKALIVGGGYIGLEAAAVATKKGLEVTLVEAGERILGRVASSKTADYFRDLHGRHGVRILENTGIRRLTGNQGRVTGAELEDGSHLEADFVVVGIGVTPRTALAETAGLRIENGIAVDETGRSSDPDIYSVGDCASFPYRGSRIRLESVGNAIAQAEAAAAVILGGTDPYIAKPWFWSDQYDVKLQIAGLHTGHDQVVERRQNDSVCSFWYFRGPELLAIDALNDPRAYMMAKRWIESGQSPAPSDVGNPEVELKTIAATANASLEAA